MRWTGLAPGEVIGDAGPKHTENHLACIQIYKKIFLQDLFTDFF